MTDEQPTPDARARADALFNKVVGHWLEGTEDDAIAAIIAHNAETATIEREACAKITDSVDDCQQHQNDGGFTDDGYRQAASGIAAAIRARGTTT